MTCARTRSPTPSGICRIKPQCGLVSVNDYLIQDIATRLLWTNENPTWRYDEAAFQRSAASWENPDYVDVVIYSYRHRLGRAPGYP